MADAATWTRRSTPGPTRSTSPLRGGPAAELLASLANGLRERAARRGADAATADLVESVTLLREAVAALTGFRELAGQLANLGLSLHGLAVRTEDVAGYREACATFAAAVESGLQVATGEALRAGLAWQAMAVDTVADSPQAAAAGDGVLRACGLYSSADAAARQGDVAADRQWGRRRHRPGSRDRRPRRGRVWHWRTAAL